MTRSPRHLVAIAASVALPAVAGGAPARAQEVSERPLPAIVATGPTSTAAVLPDDAWRVELAPLLPGDTDAAVAPDGVRVAFVSARDGNQELYLADAGTGEVSRLTRSRVPDRRPSWSPDGQRLVWQSGPEGASDLLVRRLGTDGARVLVTGPGDDVEPAWSPDGRRIAFSSTRGGRRQLWAVGAAGGEPQPLAEIPGRARAPAWSPGGRRIAFARESEGDSDIWALALRDGSARPLTRGAGWDSDPDWSPDGEEVTFARAAARRTSIWVVVVDGGRGGRPVESADGLTDPDWARTARSLVPRPDELLPDLDQRTPAALAVIPAGRRFLLGFASSTENRGVGPLVVRGVREGRSMRAHQIVELHGGGSRVVPDVGRMHFELHKPHFHWHLQSFITFELQPADRAGEPVRDRKTGFCLIDRWGRVSPRIPGTGPPRFVGDCGAGKRRAREVEQGTSVGYVDRYGPFFHGQNVDLTGLPAGRYLLVHRANPDRAMRELAYANNAASLLVRLAWPGGASSAPRVTVLRRCGDGDRCG